MARRFGSAMISKTDSTLLIYSTEHMLVKVYKGRGRGKGFSRRVVLVLEPCGSFRVKRFSMCQITAFDHHLNSGSSERGENRPR